MSLIDFRASIIGHLKDTAVGITENCAPHGGRFTQAELKRLAVKTPAILVACLGLVDIEDNTGGSVDVMASWGAFVVTADRPGVSRDAGALAILTALTQKVPGNKWGRGDVGYPERVRADNLYSGQVEAAGVAMWAVTWQQGITLGGLDASTLDIFATLHADYDLAQPDGQIDASDTVTLPQ